MAIDRGSDRFRPRSLFPLFPFYFLAFFLFWKAQPSAFSLSPFHPLLHCSCPAAPSSARRLTSAARSAREARPHELREGGGQYGEAPCPHEHREVKGLQRPPRRARPCSYASYPGWTSPRALSPPASPSSPTASAIPVASEDFQVLPTSPSPLPSDESMADSGHRLRAHEHPDLTGSSTGMAILVALL